MSKNELTFNLKASDLKTPINKEQRSVVQKFLNLASETIKLSSENNLVEASVLVPDWAQKPIVKILENKGFDLSVQDTYETESNAVVLVIYWGDAE